jgi:3-deoxy-D-manno-octulosonic-acid transferase
MTHVLVHGASIGELLAAETVVAGLRNTVPDLLVTYSYTSPSVAHWPSWPADAVVRLPLPLTRVMGRWLDRLRPDLLVLSRGDLWPAMLRAAQRRRIPVAVIGGRIRPGSPRLRRPIRALFEAGVRTLAHVGVVDEDEAIRWIELGAMPERVVVTGDPAVDRALAYQADPAVVAALRSWAGGEPILVLGSVEPSDRHTVQALLAEGPRAVIVPHDPERTWRLRLGDAVADWTPGTAPPPTRGLVIRTRGHLADCYAAAAAAFVGGWHGERLHSRLEVEARRAVPIVGETSQVVAGWRFLRDSPGDCRRIGKQLRAAVECHAGAAAREAAALLRLLRK